MLSIENIFSPSVLATGVASLAVGYSVFIILLNLLPKKLRAENLEENQKIIVKAQKRKDQIIRESKKIDEEKMSIQTEEQEASLKDAMDDLEATKREIQAAETYLTHGQARLAKTQKEMEAQEAKVDSVKAEFENRQATIEEQKQNTQQKLASLANCNIDEVRHGAIHSLIEDKQLESQKILKELIDDLSTHSKKKAHRSLDSLLSRYSPEFVWPKATNHVDIPSPKIVELLESDKHTLLEDLRELSEGVEITLWREKNDQPYIVRLGGGYGIYKEAARLTIESVLTKHPSHWEKADKIYQKHRKILDQQASSLGAQAVRTLRLANVHEEIQRMIGALNWRTSYRQNQFYHSVEVAKLAGILANELNLNPDYAKRCGILHDIGKGIDYRIEGSHAVISGDYADRFGESRLICDTVMSHHNDLVLETALSYVLKTADTLSGARPGARINLEEGYQVRLSAIDQVIKSFPGILKTAIMNGGREVHIEVHHKKVGEEKLKRLANHIARKIEEDVAFPGQIKVIVSRRYEAVTVA